MKIDFNKLEDRIEAIPGGEGWWKDSSYDLYLSLARTMITKGFSEDEAVLLLSKAYWSVAGEFGE